MDKWGGSIYESVHWRLQQKTGHQFKCPTIRMEITKNYDVLLFSCEVVSNSSVNPWTVPTRHLCPLDFPGKNTGVRCHFHSKGSSRLGLSPCFLHCRQILYHWATSSVQSFSRVWPFMTPWTAAHQASLSITNSRISPKSMSIKSVMPSNHLILCHSLLLLPSIFPSIRVFSNESALHIRWPKYWSFSFNISPTNEHLGLSSFRMDWLDLLTVQGTLKSLLQHHSSKASILRHSAFFIVQLSYPYMTTGKTIALPRWTFVGKVSAF